jgi:predicted ATPase
MATIKSWGVSDFKALASARLKLPPVTVLTGANSSGKSSILQSLLVVGQSVERGSTVVLNGPLVRLGLPKDVVRTGQKTLQFKFTVGAGIGGRTTPSIEVTFSLAPDGSNSRLVIQSLEVVDIALNQLLFGATTARLNSADAGVLEKSATRDTSFLRVTTIGGKRAPSRMYLSLKGLLPAVLIAHKDRVSLERIFIQSFGSTGQGERLPYETLQELSALVEKTAFLRRIKRSVEDQDARGGQPRWTARDINALAADDFETLVRDAAAKRADREWVALSPDIYRFGYGISYSGLMMATEGIIESVMAPEYDSTLNILGTISQSMAAFGHDIRYLGPLRDEPRVVHGAWDERMSSLPVGIRGELTAEVLTRDKNQRVTYFNSENIAQAKSLPAAVADWCSYLGIGDHINVLDLGKLGRGVELRVNGVHRDLTTIGVGASQLLPVIVAGLSVPKNSIMLVEQPELHLHPQVQSRLADFFLFARPDVRFIVETHSEYLITRMRLRIAERALVASKVQVLFAEQVDGATSVRGLELSDLGDFEHWPTGFFDAQDADSVKIAKAVSARIREGGN